MRKSIKPVIVKHQETNSTASISTKLAEAGAVEFYQTDVCADPDV